MRKIPRPSWWRRRPTDPAEYVARLAADQHAAAEARREIDASVLPSRAELDAERATRCLHGNPLTEWCPGCWASAEATAAAPPSRTVPVSEIAALVECGAVAGHCFCRRDAEHQPPHRCASPSCSGEWIGSYADDTFEVVRVPMFGSGPLATLRAMLADADDEEASTGTLPNVDGTAWDGDLGPLPVVVPPVIHDQLDRERALEETYVPDSSTDPGNPNGPLR